jgi:uncharacterized protein (DUF1330 family)
MSAYVVGNFKVTNPEGFGPYGPASAETIIAHGGEILAADPGCEPIEGEPRHVSIVLRFEDKDAARAWYQSPEYQAIVHIRHTNAEGTLALADGFSMPG